MATQQIDIGRTPVNVITEPGTDLSRGVDYLIQANPPLGDIRIAESDDAPTDLKAGHYLSAAREFSFSSAALVTIPSGTVNLWAWTDQEKTIGSLLITEA